MEEIIHVPEEQSETGNLTEYTESVVECFDSVPEVAKPLIGSAGRLLNRIEKMLVEQEFKVKRAEEEDIRRILAVYFEQNVTTEKFEEFDGERWIILND